MFNVEGRIGGSPASRSLLPLRHFLLPEKMEAACPSAPLVPGDVVIKTEPECEDDVVSSSRDVPVKRDPVVPLLSPVSGLRPLSWSQDHRLAVCTSSSLSVMELVCDVHSNKQDLTLHRTSISVPNESHKLRVSELTHPPVCTASFSFSF